MSRILNILDDSIYERCEAEWTRQAQLTCAAEEASEMAASICRHLIGKCDADEVLDEMADVAIMLGQLERFYPDGALIAAIGRKAHKLGTLLDGTYHPQAGADQIKGDSQCSGSSSQSSSESSSSASGATAARGNPVATSLRDACDAMATHWPYAMTASPQGMDLQSAALAAASYIEEMDRARRNA